MKTKKIEVQPTKPSVETLLRQCRRKFEYCSGLTRRTKPEALRAELLGILESKIRELRDSFDAAIVVSIMTRAGDLPKAKTANLSDSYQADFASAQVVLGELKSR